MCFFSFSGEEDRLFFLVYRAGNSNTVRGSTAVGKQILLLWDY